MSVRAVQLPQSEAYVSRKQMAELMGVSVATVDRWIARGMPHERWGIRAVRLLPSRALQWAREQERRAA